MKKNNTKKNKETNLLYISPDFDYACGVSKHVYINLKYLSQHTGYKLFFITNNGDSLDRLEKIPGLSYSIFNFEKDHKNIFNMLADLFRLYKYCKKNKIEIIHTHHRYPELLAVIISKLIGIKTVTTVHSFVNGLNIISFRSHKIITVSKSVEEYLKANFSHTKKRCTTMYNCIDKSFYEKISNDLSERKKSLGYDENDKILFFAGRISLIKGFDVLIEAFNSLPDISNAKLLIIGSVIDNQINSLLDHSNDKIKIIGPEKDIKLFYQISDLVILPSRKDPFPYVMIEAGAMEKVFIGGNTGGIAEFIEDGVNGILVEPGNSYQLANKINYLLSSPKESDDMAKALFNKVKKECNCEKYFESLNQIYNQVLI
jgi:glycosyltransferase involved in cell wall biosynthesis